MKRIITAAATCVALTGTASASELAQVNAVSCGSVAEKPNAVSTFVGGKHDRARPITLATHADTQFRGMAKLRMIYQHDGYTETEHCGGTVIDSRYIVTAAHCVVAKGDEKWDRIEITVGDTSLDGEGTIQRVSNEAICHAGNDSFLANDVALIKLREPLPPEIVPARIDDFRRPTVKPGGIAISAGFPVTGPFAGETTLRKTALAVKDVEWPGFITVTSPSGRVEGVCQGESGGPLLSQTTNGASVAGVLSGIEPGTNDHTGEPCMKAGYEMYFTPLAAYRQWIDTVMNLCLNNPDACRPGVKEEFFMSSAPQHNPDGWLAASVVLSD